MSVRGYCTPTQVYERSGRTLPAQIVAQIPSLIEKAEAYLDVRLGKRWMTTITDEFYVVTGPYLKLRSTPVASVTSIKYWSAPLGGALAALIADQQYSVHDLTRGMVYLPAWTLYSDRYPDRMGQRLPDGLYVTYVPSVTAPVLAQEAALRLVTHWLSRAQSAIPSGASSFAIPGAYSVTFSNPVQSFGTSLEAEDMIGKLSGGVVFA